MLIIRQRRRRVARERDRATPQARRSFVREPHALARLRTTHNVFWNALETRVKTWTDRIEYHTIYIDYDHMWYSYYLGTRADDSTETQRRS